MPPRLVLGAFLMLTTLACSDAGLIDSPALDRLVVQCILLPSQARQKIWVSRTVPNQDNAFVAVNEAEVTVNETVFALQDSVDWRDPYNFYSEHLAVIPGSRYTLRLHSPKYGEVFGEVFVPGEFEILAPAGDARLQWTQSRHAYAYAVNLLKTDFTVQFFATVRDTFYVLPPGVTAGAYFFEVSALDQNYHSFTTLSKPAAGISGAYGLMGAVLRKKQGVLLGADRQP